MTARRRPRGEDGSVLLLVIGLFAVLVGLVGVVVDVSAVVLAKRSLSSAADGAAIAGAQALDYTVFYANGPGQGVPLSGAGVRDRVATYADGIDQPGLRMTAQVESGYTAAVTASRTVQLPFSRWLGVTDLEIGAVARARAPLVVP